MVASCCKFYHSGCMFECAGAEVHQAGHSCFERSRLLKEEEQQALTQKPLCSLARDVELLLS